MLRLLQISDLHFGPHLIPQACEAMLRLAPRLKPDVIVVTGDLTQRAKAGEFADARALLERLPDVPRVTIPGNHDVPLYRVWERLFAPYALYQQYISSQLDQILRLDDAMIIALNSTSPRRAIVNGRIHLDQLELCREAFRDAPSHVTRIVAAHHHFAPAPDYQKDQVMPRAKRAMDCFIELGVDLILGGHLHRSYIGNSLDLYPGPRLDKGIVIVQCGTTASRRGRAREREKNSLNLVCLDQHRLEIIHYLYFEQEEEFRAVSRHLFPGRAAYTLTTDEAAEESLPDR